MQMLQLVVARAVRTHEDQSPGGPLTPHLLGLPCLLVSKVDLVGSQPLLGCTALGATHELALATDDLRLGAPAEEGAG